MFPPFWKQDSHYVTVEFSKAFTLEKEEVITIACEGRFNFMLDGKLTFLQPSPAVGSTSPELWSATIPKGEHKLNLKAASVSNGKGVADQYLRDIRYDLEDMGLSMSDYDPTADYDGDGVSNYAEYLAGTDAFDPSDAGLKILSWRKVEGNDGVMEATFLPGRGRAYSVERSATGGEKPVAFEHRPHQTDPAPGAPSKNYLITEDEDPEIRAVYLYKEGASSLYRLRLE